MAAPSPPGLHTHDQTPCVETAVSAAEAHCEAHKLRFTDSRRRVLSILLESPRAMGAYEILAELGATQPPMVYRALEFLTTHGFAHKIEGLNAFVACAHPGQHHDPAFMICRNCGKVTEAMGAVTALEAEAAATGFVIERQVIEAEGLCPACQDAP